MDMHVMHVLQVLHQIKDINDPRSLDWLEITPVFPNAGGGELLLVECRLF